MFPAPAGVTAATRPAALHPRPGPPPAARPPGLPLAAPVPRPPSPAVIMRLTAQNVLIVATYLMINRGGRGGRESGAGTGEWREGGGQAVQEMAGMGWFWPEMIMPNEVDPPPESVPL
jgi:hypothetical protein